MKRRAFISYSMQDSEQYVLTLLSNLLREEGFQVDSSFDSLGYGDSIEYGIKKKISESDLFIGVITQTGRNNYVMQEWEQAQKSRIPSLLLIEDKVKVNPLSLSQPSILRFNKYYPEDAILKATSKIKHARNSSKQSEGENVAGWLLGGLAILALIKLLSND